MNGRDRNESRKSVAVKEFEKSEEEIHIEPKYSSVVEEVAGLIPRKVSTGVLPPSQNKLPTILEAFFREDLASRTDMDSVLAYINEDPLKVKERAEEVERLCAQLIDSEQQPNISGMLLISEIEKAQGAVLFDNKLTLALYRQFRPHNIRAVIDALTEANTAEGNVVLHQFLDFCQRFWSSLQNIVPGNAEYWEIKEIDGDWEGPPTFTQEMAPLLKEEMVKAKNYLLQKHFADALSTIDLWGDKEDGLSGSPGGMSDATIFSYRVLGESIDLRRRMNIWSGYAIAQELVPIAPGYVGLYVHGELQKVFPEVSGVNHIDLAKEDKELISQNDDESYDWIYDSLNLPESEEGDPSLGLQKLKSLWNLDEDLGDSNDLFYYDVDRIKMESLHPAVRSQILERNFYRLQSIHKSSVEPKPLSEKEFQSKLFPAGSASSSQEYLYKHLSSFSMREKVQGEFGISIARLSFAEQMHFLTFLSTQSEENFKEVKQFSKSFGIDALRTFLVVGDDQVLREQVYSFSQSAPVEDVRTVLESYGALVSTIDELGTYLVTNFGSQDGTATEEVTAKILERSKRFLADSVSADPSSLESVTENLERVKSDALVFAAAFRTLRERGELKDIETVRGVSLVTEPSTTLAAYTSDVKKIEQLMEQAYRGQPDVFRAAVLDSFRKALSSPDSRFYVLRRDDEIIASLRFDDVGNEEGKVKERYFGSFVSDAVYGNGQLGEAIFEKAIVAEAAKGEPVSAHCNPLSPITQKYIETGFVATKLEDYAGVPSFSIRLDAKTNTQSETKSWKPERIVQAALSQNNPNIQAFSVKRAEEIPFNLVNQGFSLTRYLKQGERLYAVFERLSPGEKGSA